MVCRDSARSSLPVTDGPVTRSRFRLEHPDPGPLAAPGEVRAELEGAAGPGFRYPADQGSSRGRTRRRSAGPVPRSRLILSRAVLARVANRRGRAGPGYAVTRPAAARSVVTRGAGRRSGRPGRPAGGRRRRAGWAVAPGPTALRTTRTRCTKVTVLPTASSHSPMASTNGTPSPVRPVTTSTRTSRSERSATPTSARTPIPSARARAYDTIDPATRQNSATQASTGWWSRAR